jgi:hypothetical protein
VDRERPELVVVDVIELPVHRVDPFEQHLLGVLQDGRIVGVDVDPHPEERGRDRVPGAVQQVHALIGVGGLPQDVVRVLHRRDVVGDQIVLVGDARRVDRVRRRVASADVVERLLEDGPDVREVRDVGLVQGLDQLAVGELPDVLGRHAHDEVVLRTAGLDLRDHLLRRVEDGVFDLHAVLLCELIPHLLPDVVVVSEDPERSGLRREVVGDRRIGVEDRQLDRVVGPGELKPVAVPRATVSAGRLAVAAARGEDRGQAR